MERRDRAADINAADQTVPPHAEILSPQYYDAVVFELDGVVANTVELHFAAYKEVFDTFLRSRYGREYKPFTREEFRQLVDGKPRWSAIESFLGAREITLPLGEELPEADEALRRDTDTIYGLARMKANAFRQRIESGHLRLEEGVEDLFRKLIRAGIKMAVVSPSAMARRVLDILDLEAVFDVVVDAETLEEEDLAGKPGIDIFVEAITSLEVTADRAAIIEDDRPSVEAGRGGSFGLIVVVGADSGEDKKRFLRRGADLAINELSDLKVQDQNGTTIQ